MIKYTNDSKESHLLFIEDARSGMILLCPFCHKEVLILETDEVCPICNNDLIYPTWTDW